MKHILKSVSIILCLLLLLTSVISCAPSETQTTEESTTQAPEETVTELTIDDLTEDFTGGEYTLDESPVRPHELLTALYRIAGEPEASRDFEVVWNVGEKDSYYHDATVWSAFQAGIIPFAVDAVGETSNYYVIRTKLGFRVGVKTVNEVFEEFSNGLKDCEITSIESSLNYDTDISRTDAILAMYYYVTTYLGKDIVTDDVLENIEDHDLFTKNIRNTYKMYVVDHMYTELRKDLSASWNWALDAGIVEPYSDNTLRPDATLTRAEFATMLTRFMDYVK